MLIDGTAHDNFIGDYYQSVIPQNTFSGNLGYGLALVDGAHDNQIFNNFIGVDVIGRLALSNQQGGIYVGAYAARNAIGGTSTDPKKPKKNLVSGNVGNGVTLDKGSSYTSVIDNWIGLDKAGKYVLPNSGRPIVVKPGSVHNKIYGNVTCCNKCVPHPVSKKPEIAHTSESARFKCVVCVKCKNHTFRQRESTYDVADG